MYIFAQALRISLCRSRPGAVAKGSSRRKRF